MLFFQNYFFSFFRNSINLYLNFLFIKRKLSETFWLCFVNFSLKSVTQARGEFFSVSQAVHKKSYIFIHFSFAICIAFHCNKYGAIKFLYCFSLVEAQ